MLTFRRTALGRLLAIYWLPEGRLVSALPVLPGQTRCIVLGDWGGVVTARLYPMVEAFTRVES